MDFVWISSEQNERFISSFVRALFLLACLLSFFPQAAFGEPYAWPHFTSGEPIKFNFGDPQDPFPDYIVSFVEHSRVGGQSEIGLTSYSWAGGSGNEPVSGWRPDNEGGLNKLAADGLDGFIYITGDKNEGEDNFLGYGGPVSHRASFVDAGEFGGNISHSKIISIQDEAVIFGSGNVSYDGYGEQPNVWLLMRDLPGWSDGTNVVNAFHDKIKEMHSGTNFVQGRSPQGFQGPNGEEITIYFQPDITPGLTIADVIVDEINQADQSVQYLINVITDGNTIRPIEDALATFSDNNLVEGVIDDKTFATQETIVGRMEEDHTVRRWSTSDVDASMHHKTMIIDQETIIFGSANYSNPAMGNHSTPNQETVVKIDDFRLARAFMMEFNRYMQTLDSDNVGGQDSFNTNAPAGVTNFQVENIQGQDNSLQLSWEGQESPENFSRYYVFATDYEISTNEDICDFQDSDGSGSPCDDPVTDVTGFAAGPGLNSLSNLDNNADGVEGGDPFVFPEKQILVDNSDPGEAILDTFNYGEVLDNNKDLWVGIVAVDAHGNESPISVVGPVQSQPADPGADPKFSIDFDSGASRLPSAESTLRVELENDTEFGEEEIIEWTMDVGSGANAFQLSASQNPPAGWSASVNGSEITFEGTSGNFIAPGDITSFSINVTNPSETGQGEEITASTLDSNGVTIPGISLGTLLIEAEEAEAGIETISVSDGTNSITDLDGSERLLQQDATVSLKLDTAPEDTPVLFYRMESNPEGDEGSGDHVQTAQIVSGDQTAWEATISSSVTDFDDGNEVRFLWKIGDQVFDRSGLFYLYEIDGSVSDPQNLAVEVAKSSSVELSFDAIGDNDFERYEIFYSTGSPVDTSAQSQSENSKNPGPVAVSGLSEQTSYFFNIRAVDDLGNVSPLNGADEVSATTGRQAEFLVDRAEDGVNTIEVFDGSEALRDENITVFWNTEESWNLEDVALHYKFSDKTDVSFDGLESFTEGSASGADTSFQAVIPESADGFEPGKAVLFVIELGNQVITRGGGQPFSFTLDDFQESVENFRVKNTEAGAVTLGWQSIPNRGDFKTYRVYWSDTDNVNRGHRGWDNNNDGALISLSTTETTITGLDPNQTYFFRITPVNDLGSEGPLSNEVSGMTNTSGSLLISEINFSSANGIDTYVELTALAGPIDISGFMLSDMDPNGADSDTFADSPITLETGERVIVHPFGGTPETDSAGDLDGDGIRDLYTTNLDRFTNDESNEVVLFDDKGDSLDAVVYKREADQDTFAAASDVDDLVPIQWNSADTEDMTITVAQSGLTIDNVPAIVREINPFGKILDSNTKNDWTYTTQPSPGKTSEPFEIVKVEITDSPTRRTHLESSTLTRHDGSEFRKGDRTVRVYFNQPPVQEDHIRYAWEHDANPSKTGNQSSGFNVVGTKQDMFVVERGNLGSLGSHGEEERAMILSRFFTTTPAPEEIIGFDRSGRFYRHSIDNRPPGDFDDFFIREVSQGKVSLNWSRLSVDEFPDFKEYRIYFDTGAVDLNSRFVGADEISGLGDIRTSGVTLTMPVTDVDWEFSIGAVDDHGNISDINRTNDAWADFSDTTGAFVPDPIDLELFEGRDGLNTVNLFRDGRMLTDTDIVISARFDRNTDTAIIHWNTTPETPANPDDAGVDTQVTMSQVLNARYSGNIPAQPDGTELTLAMETDGDNFDNRGEGYNITVDGTAPAPVENFQFSSYSPAGSNSTSIHVTWDRLSRTFPGGADFAEYRVLYDADTTAPFTGSEQILDSEKKGSLSDSRASGVWIDGLESNTGYVFGIRWVDVRGNKSVLSDTFDTTTIVGEPADDPVYDGTSWATKLDGSEYLQGNRDYLVRFNFLDIPEDTESVKLHYNAHEVDQTPFEGEGEFGTVSMKHADGTTWETTLDKSLPGISDAGQVSYWVEANGLPFHNDRLYYRFRLDHNPIPPLSGVSTWDRGDEIRLYWDRVNENDFETYRIRYRETTSRNWSVVDKSNDGSLGDPRTSSFVIPTDPARNYEINLTAVDRATHKQWQEQNLLLKRTENVRPILELSPDRLWKLYPGEENTFEIYLENLDGQPWSNKKVKWTVQRGDGIFVDPEEDQRITTTNADGMTSARYRAGQQAGRFNFLRLYFDDDVGTPYLDVVIYVVPEGEDKSDIGISYSGFSE